MGELYHEYSVAKFERISKHIPPVNSTLKLVACIEQVPVLNLGLEPGYPQFSSFP